MSANIQDLIEIATERALTRSEAETAFDIIMAGASTPSQTGGFLMTLRTRGAVSYTHLTLPTILLV